MARLKEEGEHFKRLQSTRGHFQTMSERLCPSRGILPLTEGEKLFWFSRTQNSLLLPFDQLNQPRNAWTNIIDPSAGHLSYATQAQLQPSAPPSPTFTPSTPATSMPSGVIPQDPRLPSLYLPSYDEAVNMQQ